MSNFYNKECTLNCTLCERVKPVIGSIWYDKKYDGHEYHEIQEVVNEMKCDCGANTEEFVYEFIVKQKPVDWSTLNSAPGFIDNTPAGKLASANKRQAWARERSRNNPEG